MSSNTTVFLLQPLRPPELLLGAPVSVGSGQGIFAGYGKDAHSRPQN